MSRTKQRKCLKCGATFQSPLYNVKLGWGKYCGRKCQTAALQVLGANQLKLQARSRRPNVIQPKAHRLIPLTQGRITKVSVEDYVILERHNWQISDSGYAKRTAGRKNIRMHRVVLERKLRRRLRPSEQVDHINGNRLDNRRQNLRLATNQQNGWNARAKTGTSRYRGVHFSARLNAWVVRITLDGQSLHLGVRREEDEAAYLYDQFALALYGDFARLNVL